MTNLAFVKLCGLIYPRFSPFKRFVYL